MASISSAAASAASILHSAAFPISPSVAVIPSSQSRIKPLSATRLAPISDVEMVQEFRVYEMNEKDRGSPVYLPLSQKPVWSLGDLSPFTNKIYSGDLKKRLGITAGICALIRHEPDRNGGSFEVIDSFYFGDYGHISVRGTYFTYKDSYLAVTGGSGVFEGAYGQVKLHHVYRFKFLYTFYLRGIPELPAELVCPHVEPTPDVEPSTDAKAALPHATVSNYSD